MILLQNERVGCEQCIRGHRAADCVHLQKYLISIKGRGRPAAKDQSVRFRIRPNPTVIQVTREPIESKNGRGKSGTTKICHHLHPLTEVELYEVKLGKGFKVIGPASEQAAYIYTGSFRVRRPTAKSTPRTEPLTREQIEGKFKNQLILETGASNNYGLNTSPTSNMESTLQVKKEPESPNFDLPSNEHILQFHQSPIQNSTISRTPASTSMDIGANDSRNIPLEYDNFNLDFGSRLSVSTVDSSINTSANSSSLNLQTMPDYNNFTSFLQMQPQSGFTNEMSEMNELVNAGAFDDHAINMSTEPLRQCHDDNLNKVQSTNGINDGTGNQYHGNELIPHENVDSSNNETVFSSDFMLQDIVQFHSNTQPPAPNTTINNNNNNTNNVQPLQTNTNINDNNQWSFTTQASTTFDSLT